MKRFALTLALALIGTPVFSQDISKTPCPSPQPNQAPTCKILTLTPQEEQALLGAQGILESAEWARRLDLQGPVTYFRNKIQSAPAGVPYAAEAPAK